MSHEIEYNDGIAYVGDTPWHGIGEPIPAGTSIDDAMEIACKRRDGRPGMWEIQKRPITVIGGAEIVDHHAMVRDDTGEALGVVGNVYTALTNKAATDWYRPILDSGLATVEVAGTLKNGRIVWILAKLKNAEVKIGTGDYVNRYTLLAHGHDGSLTIQTGLTDVRVVCRNTLAVATSPGNKAPRGIVRVRHTKNHPAKLEDARKAIMDASGDFEKVGELYRELAARPVRSAKQVTAFAAAVFGEVERAAQAESKVSKRLEGLVDRFENGTGQNLKSAKRTWWGMYNALTEYVSHVGGHTAESRAESTAFGEGSRVLARGLTAALELSKHDVGTQIADVAVSDLFPGAIAN